jgi:hypothetical protein
MRNFHFISLTFFAVLTLTNAYGQDKQDKTAAIAHIRQVFQQINSYKNYRVISIDDSEEFLGHATDNGGSLDGYYKGDSLMKIVAWVGLSNRVVQHEYYFNKGKLVFVQRTAGVSPTIKPGKLIVQNLTVYLKHATISARTNSLMPSLATEKKRRPNSRTRQIF